MGLMKHSIVKIILALLVSVTPSGAVIFAMANPPVVDIDMPELPPLDPNLDLGLDDILPGLGGRQRQPPTALQQFCQTPLIEKNLGNRIPIVGLPWRASIGIYGYDLFHILFFGTRVLVDKKLYSKFDDFYKNAILRNFSGKVSQLLKVLEEAGIADHEDELAKNDASRLQLIEHCHELFSLQKEFNLKMLAHFVLFGLVLSGVSVAEDKVLGVQKNENLGSQLARYYRGFLIERDPQPLQISPIRIAIEYIRNYYYGIVTSKAGAAKMAYDIRGYALAFAKDMHDKDSWYYKSLDVLETATQNEICLVLREMFVLQRSMVALKNAYAITSKKILMEHGNRLIELLEALYHARSKGDRAHADKCEEKIKAFILEINELSFAQWYSCKENSITSTNIMIDRILTIPAVIEVFKLSYRYRNEIKMFFNSLHSYIFNE